MGHGVLSSLSSKKTVRLLILGLYDAGKTTLLNRLKEDITVTIPTIGLTVETVTLKGRTITAIDVGGRNPIRPLLRHYFRQTHAVLFVVDSSDEDEARLNYARDQLQRLLTEEEGLADLPLVVLANKQDVKGAMTCQQLARVLDVHTVLPGGRKVEVFPTSTLTGEGVWESLDWVLNAVTQQTTKTTDTQPSEKPHSPTLRSVFSSLSSAFKLTVGEVKGKVQDPTPQ